MDDVLGNYVAMRGYSSAITKDLSAEEVCVVPEGAANCILWNIGHVIADECNMLYMPSGLESPLPGEFHAWFDPETSPGGWDVAPNVEVVRREMELQAERVVADYGAGKFGGFEAYSLSESYRLGTVEEAIAYCALHEAMHIGVIITLIRMVTGHGVTH